MVYTTEGQLFQPDPVCGVHILPPVYAIVSSHKQTAFISIYAREGVIFILIQCSSLQNVFNFPTTVLNAHIRNSLSLSLSQLGIGLGQHNYRFAFYLFY